MDHAGPATRQALALSGRALAAHAAIQAANTAEGFERASIHLQALAGDERDEASELPQHALDLPATKEGDAQAVRLLTSIAECAVRDGGLDALRSDPSWASFLESDRIGVVLERRRIDLAGHPALQAALTQLKQKAAELA